jgi:beta-barrel assembly-enhancing protease
MTRYYTRRDILQKARSLGIAGFQASALTALCRGWLPNDLGSMLQKAGGYADSIGKGVTASRKALEDFTPEQEYFIGRTVGAVVLSGYKPFVNERLNRYINVLGQTLAQASDLPETFNGYHLLVLDSETINAFATPAGHIFVTRGMLRCCKNEGELAAILAHEIGHVQHRHGIQSIKKGRITEAIAIIGLEATKTFADGDIASLTETFGESINDITTTMISKGYSRSFEEEADAAAVKILERVGYNPASLGSMLQVMNARLKPEGFDFAKTHPSPEARISYLARIIPAGSTPVFSRVQESRFTDAMQHV